MDYLRGRIPELPRIVRESSIQTCSSFQNTTPPIRESEGVALKAQVSQTTVIDGFSEVFHLPFSPNTPPLNFLRKAYFIKIFENQSRKIVLTPKTTKEVPQVRFVTNIRAPIVESKALMNLIIPSCIDMTGRVATDLNFQIFTHHRAIPPAIPCRSTVNPFLNRSRC